MTTAAPTIEIPDSKGNLVAYTIARVPPGLDAVALRLARVDGKAVYRVSRDHAGRWWCDCPAAKYRRQNCKHARYCAPLIRLLESLS